MKTSKPDGGPAFPQQAHADTEKNRWYHTQQGMSLRDHFAGLAMQGMLANGFDGTDEKLAGFAYQTADAMLAERMQETKS